MKKTDGAGQDGAPAVPPTTGGPARPTAAVGDGGASWRLKALKRAQERAAAEGRSVQEVVGERWGSLAQVTKDLSAVSAADGAPPRRTRTPLPSCPHWRSMPSDLLTGCCLPAPRLCAVSPRPSAPPGRSAAQAGGGRR
jgi:hypothetical protein